MILGRNSKVYPMAKILCPENLSLGDESTIADFAFVHANGKGIEIGNFCMIQSHVILVSGGLIKIGDFVGISYGATILASSDSYTGEGLIGLAVLNKYRKLDERDVILENHAHVGAGAIILPGVTLGEGCTVGAGSLVTKSLPEWTICYGSPCKVIKDKPREKQLMFEREFLKEYYGK